MEYGEGIEERHTQQQHSVPGHAEGGEEKGFTSSSQKDNSRTRSGDPTSPGESEHVTFWSSMSHSGAGDPTSPGKSEYVIIW